MRTTHHSRGFSLIEILIAMVIFALGGIAILTLFISQYRNILEAAEMNRCMEIAESTRSALEASLQSTPTVIWTGPSKDGFRKLYPFALPFATLRSFSPRDERAGVPTIEELEESRTSFFELPQAPYTGDSSPPEAYTWLPRQFTDAKGVAIPIEDPGQARNAVWYMKPTVQTVSGKNVLGKDIDLDDRDVYSFMVVIRKSVARSDVDNIGSKGKIPLDGLYVAQLRIFKGYDPRSTINAPIRVFNFTLVAAE